jgi:hypothetical protein
MVRGARGITEEERGEAALPKVTNEGRGPKFCGKLRDCARDWSKCRALRKARPGGRALLLC